MGMESIWQWFEQRLSCINGHRQWRKCIWYAMTAFRSDYYHLFRCQWRQVRFGSTPYWVMANKIRRVVIGTDGTVYALIEESGEICPVVKSVALSQVELSMAQRYQKVPQYSILIRMDISCSVRTVISISWRNGTDAGCRTWWEGAMLTAKCLCIRMAATQGKFWSSPVVDADGTIYGAITNTQDESKSFTSSPTSKICERVNDDSGVTVRQRCLYTLLQ